MRKVVMGGLWAAALTGAIGAGAWAVSAQERGRAVSQARVVMLGDDGAQIGVSVRDLTADEISTARVAPAGGVLVQDVRDGSPAARAGLRSGDIVVEFDGERVRGASHFARLVRETPAGREARGTVIRDGARTTVGITPETGNRLTRGMPAIGPGIEWQTRALPPDFNIGLPADLDPTPSLRVGPPRARLGLALAPLGDQLAAYFGVKEGALVSSVAPDSPAAQAGIKAGDVIVALNGQMVRDAQDVVRASVAASPGAALDVRLVRNRKEMTVKIAIPERVDEPRSVLPV